MRTGHACRRMGFRRWGGLVAGKLSADRAAPQEAYAGLEGLSDSSQVTREQFNDLLRTIDQGLRALPATGQVGPAAGACRWCAASAWAPAGIMQSVMEADVQGCSEPWC